MIYSHQSSGALLLSLPLRLAQSTLADAVMHTLVLGQHGFVHGTGDRGQEPGHDTVAPVGGRAVSIGRRTAASADLGENRPDKGARGRDGSRGTANLRHRRSNQVSLDELHIDAVRGQLGSQRGRPLLQEGLATRVSGQQRSRKQTTEGAHGQDQAASALDHTRDEELGHTEGAGAVDSNNVVHLGGSSLSEGNGDRVTLANVVNQDGNIQTRDQRAQRLVVFVGITGEVHRQDLGFDIGELLGDLLRQSDKLRLGPGH